MILHGDCLERMREMADNSIDSVVTDPPYGLKPSKNAKAGFMGKKWDADVPSVDIWREVMRVLKPGGHLLSFGGSRTYHRMVVAIEDAGFEVRDMISWNYGSGFPKSHDVSKAIDKLHGMEREVVGYQFEVGREKNTVIGHTDRENLNTKHAVYKDPRAPITAPATPDAIKWQGFGTALKPAHEPICLARKPLEHAHTIAANVLKHGTGALNIDASRIKATDLAALQKNWDRVQSKSAEEGRNAMSGGLKQIDLSDRAPQGRWPANLILGCACEGDIHDVECAVGMLDAQSGVLKSGKFNQASKKAENSIYGKHDAYADPKQYEVNSGGASRFFYCAKSSKSERNAGLEGMPDVPFAQSGGAQNAIKRGESDYETQTQSGYDTIKNHHPTVKPIRLMEYLIRLITPHGGRVLDPFAGSGSTGVACKRLGFEFIGIELDEAYAEIAVKRIEACI